MSNYKDNLRLDRGVQTQVEFRGILKLILNMLLELLLMSVRAK